MPRIAISFSEGIRSIAGIERFIGVDSVIAPGGEWSLSDEVSVVVWGRKKTARNAVAFASKHDLPVWYLEDGFVRSCATDPHSRMTYSVILDRKGVYYDSTSGSELEELLNASDDDFREIYGVVEAELAQACLEIMVDYNVTKYNFCSEYTPSPSIDSRPVVLVVDQTVGDSSVTHGGMNQDLFRQMLDAAIEENPDSRIMVKTHPDVVAGRSTGYLTSYAKRLGVALLADAVNPISVLKTVERVYVGTSQLGMEALLCGKAVSVFGKPFYAGWGLTDDRAELPQRTATRTLRELFFAAFLWYPRYCNPITGAIWSLPECLQHVLLQKKQFARNARSFQCVGVTYWKRRYIENYLRSPDGSVEFTSHRQLLKSLKEKKCDAIATWGYRLPFPAMGFSRSEDPDIFRIEDGFLRSTGLGSDFTAPASLVIDSAGMYFDPGKPSELEYLLNSVECSLDQVLRARRLINLILSARLSKYNVGTTEKAAWPVKTGKRIILVVGQVETDASIRYGCTTISTNAELLQAVRRNNPDAWIAYKPHPDVVAGNRPGAVPAKIMGRTADLVVPDQDIISCLETADELHTMTSLAGFEALLRGKTVVTYGTPFYAGWGLTEDTVPCVSRKRQRTLEELVYFSLVCYPVYMDIETGEFASPEDIVIRIRSGQMKNNKKLNWSSRQFTKVINVCRGLSYAP